MFSKGMTAMRKPTSNAGESMWQVEPMLRPLDIRLVSPWQRITHLENEVRELREANGILRKVAGHFASIDALDTSGENT